MSKKGNRVKITWSIDKELVKKIKHKAVDMEKDASTIVETALREFLKNNE